MNVWTKKNAIKRDVIAVTIMSLLLLISGYYYNIRYRDWLSFSNFFLSLSFHFFLEIYRERSFFLLFISLFAVRAHFLFSLLICLLSVTINVHLCTWCTSFYVLLPVDCKRIFSLSAACAFCSSSLFLALNFFGVYLFFSFYLHRQQ